MLFCRNIITFFTAQKLLQAVEQPDAEKTSTKSATFEVESPDTRKGTLTYYKQMLAVAEKTIQSPDDIPGFFKVERIKPPTTKPKRLTLVYGSLAGKEVLQLLEDAEKDKV
jgi:hypothetical protein